MNCLYPIRAYGSLNSDGYIDKIDFIHHDGIPLDLPCHRCLVCQAKRRMELSLLMSYELYTSLDPNKNCFVTLTYNDRSLPLQYGLNQHDISRFLKSLKEHFRRLGHPKFEYVYSLEYGLKTGRPHYHIVFFGLDVNDLDVVCNKFTGYKQSSNVIDRIWNKGFNVTVPCNKATCSYTVGYTVKKLVAVDDKYLFKVAQDTYKRKRESVGTYVRPILPDTKRYLNLLSFLSPEEIPEYVRMNNKIARSQSRVKIKGRYYQVPEYPLGRCVQYGLNYFKTEKVVASMSLGRKYFDLYTDNFLNGVARSPYDNKLYALPTKFLTLMEKISPVDWLRIKQQRATYCKELENSLSQMTQDAQIQRLVNSINPTSSLDFEPLGEDEENYFEREFKIED